MELQDYLKPAKLVAAINPKHQRLVTKYCEAHRRVDFHVDCASRLEDDETTMGREYSKHLRLEEKWHTVACEIELDLPQRELSNIWKVFHNLIDAANIAEIPNVSTVELDYQQDKFAKESRTYSATLNLLEQRVANIRNALRSEGQS